MNITYGEIAHALEDMGVYGFPRKVGSPGQTTAANPASFRSWWGSLQGGEVGPSPMYIGHNGIQTLPRGDGRNLKSDVESYVFRSAFADFDTGDGLNLPPEQVWTEVQRAEGWLSARGVEHYWKYSGSDCGFHLHMFFREERADWMYLKRWENALWRGFKNELSLRSINIRCANPTCLERIPYTPYVHHKDPNVKGYLREENYCVPVPWELIRDGDLSRIKELSLYPEKFDTVRHRASGSLPRLEDFVRQNGWGAFGRVNDALHPMPSVLPTGNMVEWMKDYAPGRLCVQVLPFGSNPKHTVRLVLLFELINIGMGFDALFQTIASIGREAKWEDYDESVIEKQIRSALSKPGGYERYSCHRIREYGGCLGKACPRFQHQFPEECAVQGEP